MTFEYGHELLFWKRITGPRAPPKCYILCWTSFLLLCTSAGKSKQVGKASARRSRKGREARARPPYRTWWLQPRSLSSLLLPVAISSGLIRLQSWGSNKFLKYKYTLTLFSKLSNVQKQLFISHYWLNSVKCWACATTISSTCFRSESPTIQHILKYSNLALREEYSRKSKVAIGVL